MSQQQSQEATNIDCTYYPNDPKPPAFFLQQLKQYFNHVAPNATQEEKDKVGTLCKSVVAANLFCAKAFQERADKKIAESAAVTEKLREELERIKIYALNGDESCTDGEAMKAAQEKYDQTVKELNGLEMELGVLPKKLKEAKEKHAEDLAKMQKEHERAENKMREEYLELQMQYARLDIKEATD